MEVIKVNIDEDYHFDQERFWKDKDTYYSGLGMYRYVRFKLIEAYTDDLLSLHHLHEHGLKGNLQGVQTCPQEVLEFLMNPQSTVNDDVYDVDYPEDDEKLYEGALITVKANKYERNQKARRECVAKKGYQCLVCGRDFEATYGEIGKNFIHVHHLKPISSIGKEYELNVDTDLAPVCPNCHYMLHRKDPPYTIEELKEKLYQQRMDDAAPVKQKRKINTQEVRLIAEGTTIKSVYDDDDLRRLIHNMMEMDGGTMMKNVCSVCIKQFGERYGNMQPKDWERLIYGYIRNVTHRPNLNEEEVFTFVA
jgi:5-methylcytosine-specific restriction protein A